MIIDISQDGGMSKQTNNKAGAKYGVGYCDAQCARDLKFVGGKVRRTLNIPIVLIPTYSLNNLGQRGGLGCLYKRCQRRGRTIRRLLCRN